MRTIIYRLLVNRGKPDVINRHTIYQIFRAVECCVLIVIAIYLDRVYAHKEETPRDVTPEIASYFTKNEMHVTKCNEIT